ncbi:MAG: AI-2E family transporter [Verrucomicrobiales bacterium]|nr:AI-2E family transporter [Verrucomicrobiales bacterium]
MRRLERLLLMAAAFVVVVAGLRAASGIVIPFLTAVFVATIAAPVYAGMRDRGISAVTSMLVLMLALAGVSFLVVNLIQGSMGELTASLPKYQSLLVEQRDGFLRWLASKGVAPESMALEEHLDPRQLVRYVGTLATAVSTMVGQGFLILVIVVFILLEIALLPAKIRRLPGLTENDWTTLNRMVQDVRHVMGIKTLMSLLTGGVVWLWLTMLGIKQAALLALLAFLLNYLPAIGSIIASLPALLLVLAESGPGPALVCGIGYLVINIGISNFVEPRFMGRRLKLSPLIVLISIIFWGWVLGPLGMLLSVPLTAVVKLALESNPDTRWLAVLLGAGTEAPPPGAAAEPRDPKNPAKVLPTEEAH